jgi:hypothetical protein
MNSEKLIILGCDDTKSLAILMNSLRKATFYTNNIITATRCVDLINITKSLSPDLVIFCFRDNQVVLNDFNAYFKQKELPVLCISKKAMQERLYWPKDSIVFTSPMEHCIKEENLHAVINSILHLRNGAEKKTGNRSFAEQAIQDSQSSNNRDMSKVILELDQKVDVLLKVKERIASLFARVDDPVRTELMYIANSIKKSVNDSKLWEDFKCYFVKTNPEFLFQLAQKYPALTQNDLKYCWVLTRKVFAHISTG